MALTNLAKRLQKLAIDNSPALLTAIGVTGTLTTAYLTGTASFKAAKIIADEKELRDRKEDERDLELKEKVDLVWKLYVPAAGTALLTVICIIGATRIGTRRAAAVAAAYTLSEKAFTEYREKVVEKLGEKKEQSLRDELAHERIAKNPPPATVIIGGGDVLCYEELTGRYFKSDMETLKKAQNDTNYIVLNDMYATLSDFYDKIGLPPTGMSDEVGWNCDRMLELKFSTVLSDDGRPCISVGFQVAPVRDYHRVH